MNKEKEAAQSSLILCVTLPVTLLVFLHHATDVLIHTSEL